MLAPIQLKNHRFLEFNLKPEIDLTPEDRAKRSLTCRHSLGWMQDEQKGVWRARLRVELIHPPQGGAVRSLYTGVFEVIGDFILDASVPESDRLKIVTVSAGAILYGSVREWVATISARSLHGLVEMPTIDSRNFYHEAEAALKAQPVLTESQPKP